MTIVYIGIFTLGVCICSLISKLLDKETTQ